MEDKSQYLVYPGSSIFSHILRLGLPSLVVIFVPSSRTLVGAGVLPLPSSLAIIIVALLHLHFHLAVLETLFVIVLAVVVLAGWVVLRLFLLFLLLFFFILGL